MRDGGSGGVCGSGCEFSTNFYFSKQRAEERAYSTSNNNREKGLVDLKGNKKTSSNTHIQITQQKI